MNRKHALNVARFGADLQPLHAAAAVGAHGDVDEEDLLEEPRPGGSLGPGSLVTEEARLLGVAELRRRVLQ